MLSLSKPTEQREQPQADLPVYVRAEGRLHLRAKRRGAKTVIADIEEHGSCRARFPHHAHAALEATLVNIAGGIAGGDRYSVDLDVEDGAAALITTSAAERVYRSLGDRSLIETRLTVAAGAKAVWVPQEVLLYDGAKLDRRITADVAGNGMLCLTEIMVLGRTQSGEMVRTADIRDRWRIRRDGTLVFADQVEIDTALLAEERPSRLQGHSVLATALLVAPHAEDYLEQARNMLGPDGRSECAASAWNGMLLLRGRAGNADAVKQRIADFWRGLKLFDMPRIWG